MVYQPKLCWSTRNLTSGITISRYQQGMIIVFVENYLHQNSAKRNDILTVIDYSPQLFSSLDSFLCCSEILSDQILLFVSLFITFFRLF